MEPNCWMSHLTKVTMVWALPWPVMSVLTRRILVILFILRWADSAHVRHRANDIIVRLRPTDRARCFFCSTSIDRSIVECQRGREKQTNTLIDRWPWASPVEPPDLFAAEMRLYLLTFDGVRHEHPSAMEEFCSEHLAASARNKSPCWRARTVQMELIPLGSLLLFFASFFPHPSLAPFRCDRRHLHPRHSRKQCLGTGWPISHRRSNHRSEWTVAERLFQCSSLVSLAKHQWLGAIESATVSRRGKAWKDQGNDW